MTIGGHDLEPTLLARFLRSDFRTAWDAVASLETAEGRGNFMFARQAMTLLELIGRVCAIDGSGQAIQDVATSLEQIDARYFTPLPAPARKPGQFLLPASRRSSPQENQLLHAVFDLVRNGQAHQGQQIMVRTTDGRTFGISLTGASHGRLLNTVSAGPRPAEHLSVLDSQDGDVFLVFGPDVFFLDLEAVIDQTGIFQRGLTLQYLVRPRQHGAAEYSYSSTAARQALLKGGHVPFQDPSACPGNPR